MSKASQNFFITFPQCDIGREFFFEGFKPLCDQLIVCQEKHQDGNFHLHIFMKTIEKYVFEEIQDIILAGVGELIGYHLEACRSPRNSIKYCTKEDENALLHGIELSHCHLYYQACKWVDRTARYRYDDPFVVARPQYYRFLEELFNQRKGRMVSTSLDPTTGLINHKADWANIVCSWYTDWMVNGWVHKKRQMYLWGPSNTGKSQLIFNLIGDGMHVFQPEKRSNFAWADFDEDVHKVVLINEFEQGDFNIAEWKLIVEGSSTRINVKGKKGRLIKCCIPFIIISNSAPLEVAGFKERLQIVYADVNNY